MTRLLALAAGAALVLTGCAAPDQGSETSADPQTAGAETGTAPAAGVEALLAGYGLDGMTAPEIIDHLDRLGGADRPSDLMASVRPGELLLTDGTEEVTMDLPEDRFYLSVAPYVDQTHECFYHSLTTCQGELTGEEVDVVIRDDASGEVLVDEPVTIFENGFAGFWLPRDIEGTISVSYGGRTGEAEFATTEEGATCLTTLRLT